MNTNYGMTLEQSQKLIITTQLKQSLEILSMSTQELEKEIAKESEENPTIEVENKDTIDWQKYIDNMGSYSNSLGYRYSEDDEYDFENIISKEQNLYEHLKEQINYYPLNDLDKKICHYLIDSLDEDGYLRIKESDLMRLLQIDETTLHKNVQKIQMLEPSGVGARNLSECLTIQIKQLGIKNNVLEQIIKSDLEDLANRRYKNICHKYDIKMKHFLQINEMIKTLDPRPGMKFEVMKNRYIIPDVIVEKVGDEFVVNYNKNNIPTIKINNLYKEILKESKKDDQAKEYIKEKLSKASNLIRCIDSREKTILKIVNEIIKQQNEFFEKGNKYLKPMKLKELADTIGVHTSTVSRGVNGKYMLTPFGLFEMKYFFSGATKNTDDVSANGIKNRIKQIIESENKKKPYSDQKILELLKDSDIEISRRTVAKYREELNIQSSSKRKLY